MRYPEFRAVHVNHVVAEFAHLVGKTCLVTFQAVCLLMAGRTVYASAFDRGPVVHGPQRPMGPDAWKSDLGIKILIMAFQARLFCRNYCFGCLGMTVKTCRLHIHESQVGIMVELECQGRSRKEAYQNNSPKEQAASHSWSPVKNLR
jgi:hypothetical protein